MYTYIIQPTCKSGIYVKTVRTFINFDNSYPLSPPTNYIDLWVTLTHISYYCLSPPGSCVSVYITFLHLWVTLISDWFWTYFDSYFHLPSGNQLCWPMSNSHLWVTLTHILYITFFSPPRSLVCWPGHILCTLPSFIFLELCTLMYTWPWHIFCILPSFTSMKLVVLTSWVTLTSDWPWHIFYILPSLTTRKRVVLTSEWPWPWHIFDILPSFTTRISSLGRPPDWPWPLNDLKTYFDSYLPWPRGSQSCWPVQPYWPPYTCTIHCQMAPGSQSLIW